MLRNRALRSRPGRMRTCLQMVAWGQVTKSLFHPPAETQEDMKRKSENCRTIVSPEPGQVPMTQVYVNHSLLHLGDIQALTCSLLWAGHGGYWEGLISLAVSKMGGLW